MGTYANKLLIEMLYKYKHDKQQEFLKKLVPTIDISKIMGVKNPDIKKVAKEAYAKDPQMCMKYLKILPHKYLEEYILHTSILEQIKDYDIVVKEIEKVLPCIDNWATCDTYSPKIVKKHLKDFYKHILKWMKSKNTYTVRFAIQAFMSFYLDEKNYEKEKDFDYEEILTKTTDIISKIKFKSKYKYTKEDKNTCPDKYYVDMMIAWYFATLLAKNYDIAFPYIKNKKLESWTHNKSIQKAIESYRVSDKHKEELRKLKL